MTNEGLQGHTAWHAREGTCIAIATIASAVASFHAAFLTAYVVSSSRAVPGASAQHRIHHSEAHDQSGDVIDERAELRLEGLREVVAQRQQMHLDHRWVLDTVQPASHTLQART